MPRALLIILLILSGCSQPPSLPQLGRGTPSVTNRKILSGSLESRDYREIFDSMNRDGKLDGLRGYFTKPTDEELSKVGRAFSHLLYETDELLRIVSARIRARSFREPFGLTPYRKFLRELVSAPELPDFARRTRSLWSEEWAGLARKMHDEGVSYPDNSLALSAPLFSEDLKNFLATPLRTEAETLWKDLRRHSFGDKLLETFATLREDYDLAAFRGLGIGLANLLPKQDDEANKLQKLLILDYGAHRPTDGLFTAISAKLNKEPELINQLAERFRPMMTRAAKGHGRTLLSEKKQTFWLELKTKGVTPLFTAFRKTLERVAGRTLDPKIEDGAFIQNLRIYTNAFALTKWMEKIVLAHADRWATIPEAEFSTKLWDLKITVGSLDVDARSDEAFAQMKALGLQEFVKELEKAKDVQLGNFFYQFPDMQDMPMLTALDLAVETVSAVRPIADPTDFIRAAIFPFIQPPSEKSFTFADLETEDLMSGINLQISKLSLPNFRKLKNILFKDLNFLQIDDPSSDMRKLLLDFYPEPAPVGANPDPCEDIPDFSKDEPLRCRMASILDRLPALYEFDEEPFDLPSPFTTYHSLLYHAPASAVPSITGFFAFLGKAELATDKYPFFMEVLRNEVPVGRTAAALSVLGEDRDTFLEPFAEIEPHAFFSLLERMNPKLEGILQAFFSDEIWERWPALTEEERAWIVKFFGGDDWKEIWGFLSRHGSRKNYLQITAELKRLTESGYLKEAMKLLYHFQNPSLHRIADLWLEWESSGEWAAFLKRVEELLN